MPTLRSRTRFGAARSKLQRICFSTSPTIKKQPQGTKNLKRKAVVSVGTPKKKTSALSKWILISKGKSSSKLVSKAGKNQKVSQNSKKKTETQKGKGLPKTTNSKKIVNKAGQPKTPIKKGKGLPKTTNSKKVVKKAGQPKTPVKKGVKGASKATGKIASKRGGPLNSTKTKVQSKAKGNSKHLVSLTGSRTASAVAGTLDSSVPPTHRHCALRLDARLALVEPSINSDKYYVLQLLDGGGDEHWVWTRWGRTGHAGTGKIEGPLDLAGATALFNKTFREKTGVSHDDAVAGAAFVPGKYEWLDTAGDADAPAGSWEYYVDDGVDGKATGWCVPLPVRVIGPLS